MVGYRSHVTNYLAEYPERLGVALMMVRCGLVEMDAKEQLRKKETLPDLVESGGLQRGTS